MSSDLDAPAALVFEAMANPNMALIERIFGKVGSRFAPIDAPL